MPLPPPGWKAASLGLRGLPGRDPPPPGTLLVLLGAAWRCMHGFWVLNLRCEGPVPGDFRDESCGYWRVHPSTAPRRRGKWHLAELRSCSQEDPKKASREEAAFGPQCPAPAFCLPWCTTCGTGGSDASSKGYHKVCDPCGS